MGFVLSFFENFGHNIFLTKIVSLNSSRIGRCTICVLILGFSHPKTVKKTKNPVVNRCMCTFRSIFSKSRFYDGYKLSGICNSKFVRSIFMKFRIELANRLMNAMRR